MLKFELSNKDPIYNFERWYYRLPKKPFIISNAGIGDLIISARIAKYLNTGVFHFTNHSYRHKFGSEFCNLLNVHYFYDIEPCSKILLQNMIAVYAGRNHHLYMIAPPSKISSTISYSNQFFYITQ